MYHIKRFLWVALLAMSLAGCDSGRSAGSVFYSGECKEIGSTESLSTGVVSGEYPNLSCVSYSAAGDGELALDLISFWGNCAGPYLCSVEEVSEDSLELLIEKKDCDLLEANCSCPYDFQLSVDGVESGSDVALSIGEYSCAQEKVAVSLFKVSGTLNSGSEPARPLGFSRVDLTS